MEQEGACLVFCSEPRAQELLSSHLIQDLAGLFRTSIAYEPGAFLIHSQSLSVSMRKTCKQSLIHLVNTYSASPPESGQWFWYNGKSFRPYDEEKSRAIEAAYQAQTRYLILEVRGKPYQVDLAQWRQTDLTTRMARAILRNPMPQGPQHWGYWNEDQFVPLTQENSQILTQAVRARRPFASVHAGDCEMRADLTRLTLRDEGRKRDYKLGYQ